MKLHQIRDKLQYGQKIHDLKLKVVYYARVSTDKDAQLHSLDTQVSYYEQLIQQNPNWAFRGGYIDEGLSGTSVKRRKAFNRMIQDAKDGLFDLIITKETSRFSRNTLDSIHYTRELLAYSVGVFFEFDGICTFDPDAEEWLTMRAMMAQSEVKKLSARTKFGLAFAKKNGVVLGNAPYGYQKMNKKLVVHKDEAEVVRLIFHLYANELLGARRICARLQELGYKPRSTAAFNYTTINGIISNPKYIGYYCAYKTRQLDFLSKKTQYLARHEWQLIEDTTGDAIPAIVSAALWEKANQLLNQRCKRTDSKQTGQNQSVKADSQSVKAGSQCLGDKINCQRQSADGLNGDTEAITLQTKADAQSAKTCGPCQSTDGLNQSARGVSRNRYPYSGKIFCATDGSPFYRDARSYKSEVWICKKRMENGKKVCSSPVIYTHTMDNAVKAAIDTLISDQKGLIDMLADLYTEAAQEQAAEKDIQKYQTEIEKQKTRLNGLITLLLDGTLTKEEFHACKAQLTQSLSALESKMQLLHQEKEQRSHAHTSVDELKKHISCELTFPEGFDRNITDTLLDRAEAAQHSPRTKPRLRIWLKTSPPHHSL